MPSNQEIFQENMNNGHSAAWDQDWNVAAQHYRKALEIMPDQTMALTSLGLALFEQKEFDEALIFYKKAAQLSPNEPLAYEKMARIYERLGQVKNAIAVSIKAGEQYLKIRDADKSIENYINAINLQPDHLNARSRLALVYDRMGRKENAVIEYLAIASILQRSGSLTKASQAIDHCLKINPSNETAIKARQMLDKNQLLPEPTRPKGLTASVRMAEVRQMEKPEEEHMAGMDPIEETHQKALIQMASLLFDGDTDDNNLPVPGKTTGKLKKGKVIDQEAITVHLGQAIDALTHNNDEQAIKELVKTQDAGLSHPVVSYELGLLMENKDSNKALRHLYQAIRNKDYAMGAYLKIGQIQTQSGNHKDAAVAYLRALHLADTQTVSEIQTKELHRLYEPIIEAQSQQSDGAKLEQLCEIIASQLIRPDWRNYLKIARQQIPTTSMDAPPTPLSEILLETSSGQIIEAIASIQKMADDNKIGSALEEAYLSLQHAPTYLPMHIQIGELLVKEGLTQEAVHKFMLVARLYNLRGETAQAIGLLNRVIQIAPMDQSVRSFLVELLISQKHLDDAIQQSMMLARNYEYLADFTKMRKVYQDTLRLAQRSKTGREWSLKILYEIADIDMQRLDWHQAVRVFEQIRTMEPNDSTARARLVDLNFRLREDNVAFAELESFVNNLESSGESDKAEAFVQSTITDWDEKIELKRFLAELYARNKKISEAIEQLDVIASTMLESNNTPGAIQALERIISLNPPNIADYQSALGSLREG